MTTPSPAIAPEPPITRGPLINRPEYLTLCALQKIGTPAGAWQLATLLRDLGPDHLQSAECSRALYELADRQLVVALPDAECRRLAPAKRGKPPRLYRPTPSAAAMLATMRGYYIQLAAFAQ